MMESLFSLFVLLALPALLVSQWLWPLYRNYRTALKTGLPILVAPINPDNFLYMITKVPLYRYLKRICPTDGMEVSIFGWQFRTKHDSMHQRYGSAFILVTPGSNELWAGDAAMAQVVLARRKDFVTAPMTKAVMNFQGENILTHVRALLTSVRRQSDGDMWARQRRLVAPNLNERISELVWDESKGQADQMVDFMLRQPGSSSRHTIASLRAIAINVLGQVGYGQPKPFKPMELPRDPAAPMSYIDAISLATELVVIAAMVPAKLLRHRIMPLPIQALGSALERLPRLTSDMLQAERGRAATDIDARSNMMSMLVRLSDAEKRGGGEAGGPSNQYLSDQEIAGNLFIFTAAGFDTTANTMAFAVTLLSAYPDWQAWVQEEIDFVWSGLPEEDREAPDYETVFPKLTRVLAVMFEVLRLIPPLPQITRASNVSQTITTSTGTYPLEGPYKVNINVMGLHTDPAVWGPDAVAFRPSRWLTSDSKLGDSHLVTPPRGSFSPWSGGPRVCPGMKMAQVEFATVVTTLLRRCRIEPVMRPGESLAQARQRLVALTEDSMQRLTMQMNKPEEVYLRWYER
ncbi:cytochrome P450 [Thozetella sp. PMI_491]|nr:cytochrome P450 [Thozetella sp. PMI_491]